MRRQHGRTHTPPAPPATPTYDIDEIGAGVDEMVSASLAAATGPVHDGTGNIDGLIHMQITSRCALRE